MPATARPLVLIVNQKTVFEYDRNQRLPGKQREFLDFMDEDMARGIEVEGSFVAEPDASQKLNHVVASLVHAHHDGNEALRKATAAYIALRSPDLVQLQVEEDGEAFSVQLIYANEEQSVDDTSPA
ncbi:MAG: hypothetical protein OEX03_12015 [Gammaproteobacteria bacterium]|nr:hypothetical protein [Gammaproteobacteria bacterium]